MRILQLRFDAPHLPSLQTQSVLYCVSDSLACRACNSNLFSPPPHTPHQAPQIPPAPPHRTPRRAGAQTQVPLLSLTHEPSGFKVGGLAADHCLRRLTMVESVVVNGGFHLRAGVAGTALDCGMRRPARGCANSLTRIGPEGLGDSTRTDRVTHCRTDEC